MNDPNRGASEETLRRLQDESYERLRINIFEAVKKLLDEHEMSWDDLAEKLGWAACEKERGAAAKRIIGDSEMLELNHLNQIAHCFSAEIYLIFRPRFPITAT